MAPIAMAAMELAQTIVEEEFEHTTRLGAAAQAPRALALSGCGDCFARDQVTGGDFQAVA